MAVGWYIFFGILLFFAFLLSLKANIKLAFKDELVLSVRVLCFTFRIVPGKEKKPIDYKKYSYKKHQKRLRKNYAAYLAAQQKKAAKAEAKRKKKEMEAAKTPERKKNSRNAPFLIGSIWQPPRSASCSKSFLSIFTFKWLASKFGWPREMRLPQPFFTALSFNRSLT